MPPVELNDDGSLKYDSLMKVRRCRCCCSASGPMGGWLERC
jgi:hypothetical protein